MIVTFIGHSKLQFDNGFRIQQNTLLLSLIDKRKADTFLLGSRSDFNDLCLEVVTEIQKERPGIKRVYVRAEYPYISRDYENYLLESYDATYIPENVIDAGKAAYVERNFHMIDKAGLCIFYYDENYKPPLKPATRGRITREQPNSGTKVAYEYATSKRKKYLICFLPHNKRHQHKCFMRP